MPLLAGSTHDRPLGQTRSRGVEGTDQQKRKAFLETYSFLRRRIELSASLPFDKLDRAALRERVREIGTQ
jgi:hypothetical protein